MNLERQGKNTEVAAEPVPTDAQFDAYLEGNLRFPQTALGIAPMLARQLLKEGELDLDSVIQSKVSESQLQQMRVAMNNAHRAHGVSSLSLDAVNPTSANGPIRNVPVEYVAGVWSSLAVPAAVCLLAGVAGDSAERVDAMAQNFLEYASGDGNNAWRREIEGVQKLYENPAVRQRAEKVIDALCNALVSAEGKDIAKVLKGAIRDLKGEERAFGIAHATDRMVELMVQYAHDANPESDDSLKDVLDLLRK